jgi:hypothetical protein
MGEDRGRTHDVFLSYSSKDKKWADAVCAVLERHRVRCWIAPRDITPGDEWGAAIIKGLNASRVMVLIFSGHANASGQVRREVERAISQGMSVVPVRIEDVRPEGAMEYALGNTHWLDAFSPPVEQQLEKLARSVKMLLADDDELAAATAPTKSAVVAPVKSPERLPVTGDEPARTTASPRTEPKEDGPVESPETESPTEPAPGIDPGRRPHWKKWPIAMAACLFGLIATGVIIIITIRGNNGRENTQAIERDRSTVALEVSRKKVEGKPTETARDDAAGHSIPDSAASEAGSPLVGKATALSTDSLRAGTSWRGTRRVLARDTSKEAGIPQGLWLTIKARTGTQFKAVADMPGGSRDVEGTFKDGVINWKVDNSLWEGRLVGNELVGAFKSTTLYGEFSGEFRLTLADGLPPTVLTARVPPVGPLRGATSLWGRSAWSVEGDQLIKDGPGGGFISFGNREWTDYDLTYETRKSAGPLGFGCAFRVDPVKRYLLQIGGPYDRHYLERTLGPTRDKMIESTPGTIRASKWYRVKISLRGLRIRIELDDQVVFSCFDDFTRRGIVSLGFFDGAGRFRNIKVSAPDGTVLWEGPPDLP